MDQVNKLIERLGGVYLLPVAVSLIALVLIGVPSSWVTLTVAGLAMGMMIFYTNAAARIIHLFLSKGVLSRTQAWRSR